MILRPIFVIQYNYFRTLSRVFEIFVSPRRNSCFHRVKQLFLPNETKLPCSLMILVDYFLPNQ